MNLLPKDFCPFCEAKKLVNKMFINEKSRGSYESGVALTPPMGWSSWNLFRHRINEDLIKEIADSMSIALKDAGYTYVNIDDCWQGSERDEEGKLQCDKVAFKSGIKSLAEYVNSKGLKLGIYSSNGTLTCEDYPASLRKEAIDADTFASWGVEYFKYDFCHNVKIPSIAPKVFAVSLAEAETGEELAYIRPYEFKLFKRARIVSDEDVLTGSYVAGLDSRNGSFTVDFNAEKGGEYILTLHMRKEGKDEKFLMLNIGHKEYHIYVPGTKNWTPETKAQIKIELKSGKNTLKFHNPIGSRMDSAAVQYKLMGRELKRATREYAEKTGTEEKPIVFSLCEWGLNHPWQWGADAGNLWRTTPDIKPIWLSVLGIYEVNVRLYKYAKKGAWNDPDMLEVGNGALTYEENKSHFSLWCMMNAPLILGNDLREFIKADGTVDTTNKTYEIITNKAMIAVNQDSLGIQCRRIKRGMVDVLLKPISGSKVALCLFNKAKKEAVYSLNLADLSNEGFVNLSKKNSYSAYDVWENELNENVAAVNAVIPPHGVKVYIVE